MQRGPYQPMHGNGPARREIAAYALMVDGKDAAAVVFYGHHGFTVLQAPPPTLLLPSAPVRWVQLPPRVTQSRAAEHRAQARRLRRR